MQQTMWQQGIDLLIFGMGTVYVFLGLLVVCTLVMSRLTQRFFPEAPEPVARPTSTNNRSVSRKTLAVIQAAIHEHRSKKR